MRHRSWTARFDDGPDGVNERTLLLDHTHLARRVDRGGLRTTQIEQAAFERALMAGGSGREVRWRDSGPHCTSRALG